MRCARSLARLCAAVLVLGAFPSTSAPQPEGAPPAGGPTPPPEVRELDGRSWPSAIHWVGATRVGLLHVFAGDSLFTFDLLDGAKRLGEPVHLPAGWEAPLPLPIPASNLVLVPRARSGLSRTAAPRAGTGSPARAMGDTLSSYGIDAFTGRILWERGPLPSRPALAYLPDAGVLLECRTKEPVVRAIDPYTGDLLWQIVAEAWQVHPRGGYVDVLGEDGRLLDARTGRTVLAYRLPVRGSEDVASLSSPDLIVVRAKKAVLGYRLPPLPGPAGDTVAAPSGRDTTLQPAWTLDLPGGTGADCFTDARMLLPRDLVAIRSSSGSRLLDGHTGRVLWQGGAPGADVTVSPGFASAAVLTGSRLALVDVESGAAQVLRTKEPCREMGGRVRLLKWLDDDQVLLCCTEKDGRMTGMSVRSKTRPEKVWQSAAIFPLPAQYHMTSGEQAVATLRGASIVVSGAAPFVFLHGLATATSLAQVQSAFVLLDQFRIASDVLAAAYGLANLAIESRTRLHPHDQVAVWPFVDNQVGLAFGTAGPVSGTDGAALAWRRYQAWLDSSGSSSPASRTSVTGDGDRYSIVEQDFLAHAQRTLAFYRHKNVNGLGLLAPYPIAVSIEDDECTVRVLSVTGREPLRAPPGMLPPDPAGQAREP